MGLKDGAYLGSVRCVQTLRERCVMGEGDCWHLRTGHGRAIVAKSHTSQVWVHGLGKISSTRAAWIVSQGAPPPNGTIVYRICGSHDCVNPAHLRCGSRAQWGAHLVASGAIKARPGSVADACRRAREKRKLTPEQAAEIRLRPESAKTLAPVYGVCATTINDIRRGLRYRDVAYGASAFAWGAS